MNPINILLISDIHFVGRANHVCKNKNRQVAAGHELIQRIGEWVRTQNIDAVALLGDLVDNGKAEGANEDLMMLQQEIAKWDIPTLVVPGNHDCCAQEVLDIFGDWEGLHEVKGYQLITFVDSYYDNVAMRDMEKMQAIFQQADMSKPIIVLQHNVVYPAIEKRYPYNIGNADAVIADYTEKKVVLSISGHAHWGIPTTKHAGVDYFTCPALCEAPFRYCVLSINEDETKVREYHLKMPDELMLSDTHVHTYFGYCPSRDMEPGKVIERADMMGLKKIAFTEHAGQLYVSSKQYWSGQFINQPEMLLENRDTPLNRMNIYRSYMEGLRNEHVKVGLEVEVDCNGNLVLLEEDRCGWDILVGAVHFIPRRFDNDIEKGFMWANEYLLKHGVHILAHPFRYFIRKKMEVPKHLYRPLAKLLLFYGVAAELNFHTNKPDPEFFAICLEEGVKVSFGSDAHDFYEIGCFQRNIEFIEKISGKVCLQDFLYQL